MACSRRPQVSRRVAFSYNVAKLLQFCVWLYLLHCCCSFSGQLGDGAAMYLAEVVNSKGERWEIQFKVHIIH
jgi:uncharacterized protein YdiU (UPF0061 family)